MAERKHYIDWLRVLAVLLLFEYHGAQIFSHYDCYVKDRLLSMPLAILVEFLFQWHMHLLFLLAGLSSYYALTRRSPGQYFRERLTRLLVPLVFGVLVIVPPLKQLALLRSPDYHGSFLSLYRHADVVLTNAGMIHWAHLWFIAYLLIYSVGVAGIYLIGDVGATSRLRSVSEEVETGRSLPQKAGAWAWPGAVLGFGLGFGVLEAALRPGWPGGLFDIVHDWATLSVYFGYFVMGLIIAGSGRLQRSVGRSVLIAAPLALVGMGAYLGLGLSGAVRAPAVGDPHPYHSGWVWFQFLRGINSWCWVMAILGLGQHYLNRDGRVLAYLRQASYPVYILHATVVMLAGYFVVKLSLGPITKFALILLISYPVTFLIYDLLVRRTSLTRFLFGMKKNYNEGHGSGGL
jgi:glucans biosynthesis protein C